MNKNTFREIFVEQYTESKKPWNINISGFLFFIGMICLIALAGGMFLDEYMNGNAETAKLCFDAATIFISGLFAITFSMHVVVEFLIKFFDLEDLRYKLSPNATLYTNFLDSYNLVFHVFENMMFNIFVVCMIVFAICAVLISFYNLFFPIFE